MGSIRSELGKLKRSLSWAVVVLLPLMAVVTGTATTAFTGRALDDGWHTLWLRVVVFHGLFPLTVGVAALASLVWRVEHAGNRNALMGGPVSSRQVVIGKFTVVAMLAAGMQAILLASLSAVGMLVFDLPGLPPSRYLLLSVVIVLACLPVAALQSGLSMLMRSFAAPIAIALLGACAGVLILMARLDALAVVLPHALVSRATQLGTGTFSDTGTLTPGPLALVAAAAVALTAAIVVATGALLDRRDLR